jgi:putative alpha-1,2-mannosidase
MFIAGLKTTAIGGGSSNGIDTTLFHPGNVPSSPLHSSTTTCRVGQDKSVMRSCGVINQYYLPTPGSLPGNSDAGAIDSWLIWNMIRLYLVVTRPVYLFLSSWFGDMTLSVGGNKTLRITAQNLGDASYFVQSVEVNGQTWNKSWISHSDFVGGRGQSTIEFVLGNQKTERDVGPSPPSPGHHVL